MTRLRPMRSASRPTTGAASATPSVPAVTVRLTSNVVAWKVRARNGSRGCVAYRPRNAVAPARTTGAREGKGQGAQGSRLRPHHLDTGYGAAGRTQGSRLETQNSQLKTHNSAQPPSPKRASAGRGGSTVGRDRLTRRSGAFWLYYLFLPALFSPTVRKWRNWQTR